MIENALSPAKVISVITDAGKSAKVMRLVMGTTSVSEEDGITRLAAGLPL